MIQSFHACWIMKAAELEAVKEWVPKVDAVFQHFKSFFLFFINSRPEMKSMALCFCSCKFEFITKIKAKIKNYSFPTMYYKWRKVNIICFISKKTAHVVDIKIMNTCTVLKSNTAATNRYSHYRDFF